MTLKFGEYKIVLQAMEKAVLPRYKGSALLGAFRHALKNTVCALKRQACPECVLKPTCLYAEVFRSDETRIPANSDHCPPLIICPPMDYKTTYQKGSRMTFTMTLLGALNERLPYFIYAWDRISRTGIGQRIFGRRGRFHLIRVTREGAPVYDSDTGQLEPVVPANLQLQWGGPGQKTSGIAENKGLVIELKTPFSPAPQKGTDTQLLFSRLVSSAVQRWETVNRCYGAEAVAINGDALVQQARKISLAACDLAWSGWEPRSRNNEKTSIGGYYGRIEYKGDTTEFMPLLQAAQKLHVGRHINIGFGKITFQEQL